MEFSKLGVGIAAAACLTVGAAAGYLATRGNTPEPVGLEAPAGPGAEFEENAPAFDEQEWAGVEASEDVVAPAPVRPARPESPRPAPATPAVRPAPRPQSPSAPVLADARPEVEPEDTLTQVTPIAPAPIEPVRLPAPAPVAEAPVPSGPELYELELAANSVIGLQVETGVSTETAQVEDEVVARVTRDVKVGSHVAIPAGSTARGEVTLVERGGRMRERARLGVRFTSIDLADGTRLPISTETIYREGDSPGRESATKIGGGAIGGAIIGGILGGARGAAIGGSVGAGAGSAAVLAGGRNPATLAAGSPVTVRLEESVLVELEK